MSGEGREMSLCDISSFPLPFPSLFSSSFVALPGSSSFHREQIIGGDEVTYYLRQKTQHQTENLITGENGVTCHAMTLWFSVDHTDSCCPLGQFLVGMT